MPNIHKDHQASCLCCKHLYVKDLEPGYSEMTPGSPPTAECLAGEKMPSAEDLTKLMVFMHDHGAICKKFQPKD